MVKNFKEKILRLLKANILLDHSYLDKIQKLMNENLIQNGRIWSQLLKQKEITKIQDAEFKVFSQWGDDGIIQYLIDYLNIENKVFVEFGVEDYQEANTRFLLINNNWSGLVMDGSEINITKIKKDEIYWRHDLKAKSAFVTAENINQLIEEEGIKGQIGLLHIDIDGNDYWVWKALSVIDPVIVIVEYNSLFGKDRAITIPYDQEFQRTKTHYSNLYAGASLLAICDLAHHKGYSFIGCNSAGNNAYFVKNEFIKALNPISPEEGFVESKFRESRDENGKLTYLGGPERIEAIKGIKVFNTRSKELELL